MVIFTIFSNIVSVVNLQMFSEISSSHIRPDGEPTLATPTKAQRKL